MYSIDLVEDAEGGMTLYMMTKSKYVSISFEKDDGILLCKKDGDNFTESHYIKSTPGAIENELRSMLKFMQGDINELQK